MSGDALKSVCRAPGQTRGGITGLLPKRTAGADFTSAQASGGPFAADLRDRLAEPPVNLIVSVLNSWVNVRLDRGQSFGLLSAELGRSTIVGLTVQILLPRCSSRPRKNACADSAIGKLPIRSVGE